MPVQLFSRIRTVRFRKKKPKSPKPPTKPLRRLKSNIRKACKSMADRFRPHRQNPPPGNTNSNNSVVTTTSRVARNVVPTRTSLSPQRSVPVCPNVPVHAAVRTQVSGGVSKASHPPPNTGVLPSKIKIPSAGTTPTRKQSGISSPAANSQKNTGVSQTASSNAVRSSSPRPSRRRSTDSLAIKDHLSGSPSVSRKERSNPLVTAPGSVMSSGSPRPSRRGSMDSLAMKNYWNGSPSIVRRERSNSLVAAPSSLTSTCQKDPQIGKFPRKRSASLSGPRMSATQQPVLLPKRKSPPLYMLPSVCTEQGNLKDLTGQKTMAPNKVKTDVMSSPKAIPRSLSRERRRKEREEKQRMPGTVTLVKPVPLSSTSRPSPPSQSQRSAKSNSTSSLAASGSVKTSDLRRNSDTSSCGSGRPSPSLPRKDSSGMQDSMKWDTGNSGCAAKATAVAAKTTATGTSSPAPSWKQPSRALTQGHAGVTTVKVYPVAQQSSGRQNTGGGRPQSPSLIVTAATWISTHLQQTFLPYYTLAGSSSSKVSSSSSSLTIWESRGGVVGITNLGNTCYMNCMLQCLGHTPEMTELLLRKGKIGRLTGHYVDLMKQMWFPSTSLFSNVLYPRDLKLSIANLHPEFYGSGQHDAQEFLRFLLAGLQNEWLLAEGRDKRRVAWIDAKKMDKLSVREKGELVWNQSMYIEDTPLAELFMGQLLSSLYCTFCGHTSTTFDPIWDLALPFPAETNDESVVSLIDCLKTFNKEEVLEGNNRAFCSGCQKLQRCCKWFTIHRPPPILVLHLKRFYGMRSRRKLEATVEIPGHLNITPFLTDEVATELVQNGQHACYGLYAMANHSGSDSWGHYTASYKHHTTHKWYTISDDKVYSCPSFSPYTTIKSKEAYVMFYRRMKSCIM